MERSIVKPIRIQQPRRQKVSADNFVVVFLFVFQKDQIKSQITTLTDKDLTKVYIQDRTEISFLF